MGDRSRFRMFADAIEEQFPLGKGLKIADVASGKGALQAALRERGFADVTSWDVRHRNAKTRRGYRYGMFDHRNAPRGYGLVVGMHPDGATDEIIAYACKHKVPFAVCPCCIIESATAFWGAHKFSAWVDHLCLFAEKRGMHVDTFDLNMAGRSTVIVGRPIVL